MLCLMVAVPYGCCWSSHKAEYEELLTTSSLPALKNIS